MQEALEQCGNAMTCGWTWRAAREGVIEILGALSLVLQVVTWSLLFRCLSSKVTIRVLKTIWDNVFLINKYWIEQHSYRSESLAGLIQQVTEDVGVYNFI